MEVSLSAISRNLKKNNWKKKAMRLVAQQRDERLRGAYLYEISMISPECFVFVDESGVDRRTGARRTGWAPVGARPTRTSVLERGKRYHILPALTLNGLLDFIIYPGSTDGDGFLLWLRTDVLPKMNPFPGSNSVLVMDNASWHTKEIGDFCKAAGVLFIWLPPYSPDFNPIEAFFGDLKAYFRRLFRPYEQSTVSEEFFMKMLGDCAMEISSRRQQIEGHFRKSGINFAIPHQQPDEELQSGEMLQPDEESEEE